jgi:hypothetical protein
MAGTGRRIAVLDDDPTGSQTVHDVGVVTVFEPDELAAGLSSAGSDDRPNGARLVVSTRTSRVIGAGGLG